MTSRNPANRFFVVLMTNRNSFADSTLPFQRYVDRTKAPISLTQAASRRSINARAIFRASFRDPQVTNTTILSLIEFRWLAFTLATRRILS